MDSMSNTPTRSAEVASGSSQRVKGRDSLFLTARLTLAGEREVREVRVRNLSEGGLMVEIGRDVTEDTVVILTLRGVGEVTGKIAWSAEGRIGIAFDRPINPMLARKPVGKGAGTPHYAKPQLG